MTELPSITNLKLSILHKYANICFHLSVTNTFVLCMAYWIVEFIHSIHTYLQIYKAPMKLNVINNYAMLFLIVLCDFSFNATQLKYSSIWYILIMTLIFHIWSAVFNYNAFSYHNDNGHMADISELPRLFIYFNWDQTDDDDEGVEESHSIGYVVVISIILYFYIVVTHFVLCFMKSLFLYKWSRSSEAYIENAFETEFEMDAMSDATALDDDMVNDKQPMIAGQHRHKSKNGIVVCEKIKDTETMMTDGAGDKQPESVEDVFKDWD